MILKLKPVFKKNKRCDKCEFKYTFICEQAIKENIWEGFFNKYNIEINIVDTKDLAKLHKIELDLHREGRYHIIVATNCHCSKLTKECKCSKIRCDNFDEVQARKIPWCIYLFNLDIPEEYLSGEYSFIMVDEKNG